MGKYDPLTAYLKRQKADRVVLSFTDIERRLRALLPKAARQETWWNAPSVHTRAWQVAGFAAEVSPREETVIFVRVDEPRSPN